MRFFIFQNGRGKIKVVLTALGVVWDNIYRMIEYRKRKKTGVAHLLKEVLKMIKHRMTSREVAEALYKNFPEKKKEFLDQYANGWSCWQVAEGVEMDYKGSPYRLVAQDDRGHSFYKDNQDRHLLMFDARIIEIIS